MKLSMFHTVPLSIIRSSFTVHSPMVYVILKFILLYHNAALVLYNFSLVSLYCYVSFTYLTLRNFMFV